MSGFYQARRDSQGRIIPPGLGRVPRWDPSSPYVYPTTDERVFFPPAGAPLPGGSYTPPAALPGAAPIVDWRTPNVHNWMSFSITPSFSAAMLPVDYHRNYILVQNNDPVGIVFLAFGIPPTANGNNAIRLNPALGFVIDVHCPYTAVYVAANVALTVNPSGIVGTDVSPNTLPPNI